MADATLYTIDVRTMDGRVFTAHHARFGIEGDVLFVEPSDTKRHICYPLQNVVFYEWIPEDAGVKG